MTDVTANLSRMAEATDSEDRAVSLSVARGAGTDLVELNGLVVDNSESLNLHHEISAEPNQRQAKSAPSQISAEPMSEDKWTSDFGLGEGVACRTRPPHPSVRCGAGSDNRRAEGFTGEKSRAASASRTARLPFRLAVRAQTESKGHVVLYIASSKPIRWLRLRSNRSACPPSNNSRSLPRPCLRSNATSSPNRGMETAMCQGNSEPGGNG